MAALDTKALQSELKKKRICRFCLSQDAASLTNIFFPDKLIKSSAPLPIQVIAIASIEVFSDDCMPSYACFDCIFIFEYSYQFKKMCKKADTLLRQYPFVGKWPKNLEKPTMPQALQTISTIKQNTRTTQISVQQSTQNVSQGSLPKKIQNVNAEGKDNTNNISNTEQCVTKAENDDECGKTNLKRSDNDELTTDGIQPLLVSKDVAEAETGNIPIIGIDSGNKTTKPKLLNKSSVRPVSKDDRCENEPQLSSRKIQKSSSCNKKKVATIINNDENCKKEHDPRKTEPIETNIFPCPKCVRTFPLVQLRDLHLKRHFLERKFQCNECDKSFSYKYDLQRHSYVHSGEWPYKCSACGKVFARSNLLAKHEKTHTDVPKYKCVHCENSFISKEDMEKHAERHNINKPFQCKLCNKGFAFKRSLERHEVVHSSQQPFSCQYCNQSFSTTTKLHRHLTAHAGPRRHPCLICRKSFLFSYNLKRHMRCHKNVCDNTNSVDFVCSTCNSTFKSRDELIKHSKTHANEQNLACPLCKEIFLNMDILTSHIQSHSEGEAYACVFCDLFFITAEKLQLHADLDHAQEMEAYLADDIAQANEKEEECIKEEIDIGEEKLQSTVHAFQMNEVSDDENNSLKRKIKSEQETSPKVIKQTDKTKKIEVTTQADDSNRLLIPKTEKNIEATLEKTVHQNQQSPQSKRKVSNAPTPTRDVNQPIIKSFQKMPEGNSATCSAASASVQTPLIKVEKNATPLPSSVVAGDNKNAANTREKKVKVQRIRVTKAEAAAMEKDGRIKIKDGKLILSA